MMFIFATNIEGPIQRNKPHFAYSNSNYTLQERQYYFPPFNFKSAKQFASRVGIFPVIRKPNTSVVSTA